MTRPAVTFGLVAYNQERYVRAAIEGALAQEFSPMEIILSDDCSPDGTFQIMQEFAAAYRGPHAVRLRREPVNIGTVQHVINLARLAQGELMVIAAGDDISYPDRSLMLYDAWKATGAAALASWHDEMDADGTILRRDMSFPASDITQRMFAHELQAYREDGVITTVPGFCAAYPREFWANLPDPPSRLLVEDGIASALIILRGGRIHRVPKSLIAYRLLEESLSVRKGGLDLEEIRDRERKIDRIATNLLPEMDYLTGLVERDGILVPGGLHSPEGVGKPNAALRHLADRELERGDGIGVLVDETLDVCPLGAEHGEFVAMRRED